MEERSGHLKSLPAISKDDHGGTRSSSIDLEFEIQTPCTPSPGCIWDIGSRKEIQEVRKGKQKFFQPTTFRVQCSGQV